MVNSRILVTDLVDDGLSICSMQMTACSLRNMILARNLKLVLGAFEKLSGLKINFDK